MQRYTGNILEVLVCLQGHRLLDEHTVLQVVAVLDANACAGQQISTLDCSRSQIHMANTHLNITK